MSTPRLRDLFQARRVHRVDKLSSETHSLGRLLAGSGYITQVDAAPL